MHINDLYVFWSISKTVKKGYTISIIYTFYDTPNVILYLIILLPIYYKVKNNNLVIRTLTRFVNSHRSCLTVYSAKATIYKFSGNL